MTMEQILVTMFGLGWAAGVLTAVGLLVAIGSDE